LWEKVCLGGGKQKRNSCKPDKKGGRERRKKKLVRKQIKSGRQQPGRSPGMARIVHNGGMLSSESGDELTAGREKSDLKRRNKTESKHG